MFDKKLNNLINYLVLRIFQLIKQPFLKKTNRFDKFYFT